MAGVSDRTLFTRDGLLLHLRDWPCDDPRGTIVIVHGLGEHIGRYGAVAAFLNHRRWQVAGYDQRGHGKSQGARGRLAHEDDLLADLAWVIDAVRAEGGARKAPVVLLGHSLGGLVAARFATAALGASTSHPTGVYKGASTSASTGASAGGFADGSKGPSKGASTSDSTGASAAHARSPAPPWSRPVDALVLSSPALDIGMSGAQKALLAVLGPLAPDLAVGNGLKPEWLSHDAAVVAAYRADPLVHDRITPRLARFMVGAGPVVRAAAPRWTVPTLLLYGGSDRCVEPAGSTAFAAAAPPGAVACRAFASMFHEIFNEPGRGEVLAALGEWLDKLPFTRQPPHPAKET